MGFRTVVMLSNDQAHEWQHDAELGQKIRRAMNYANGGKDRNADVGGYGRVVECVHADNQSLAVLDGYTSCDVIAQTSWQRDEQASEIPLKLLKKAAKNLGYQVVKRSASSK